MDSKLYRALTAMLWLALPLTALQYWSVWDQLPGRMATHFGVAGQPNGWMTRETSLIFAMVVTTLVLVALTWALTRVRKPDVLAWSLLAMLYVVMGALFSINVAVLNYNLHGAPAEHCSCSGRCLHRGDCRDGGCAGKQARRRTAAPC